MQALMNYMHLNKLYIGHSQIGAQFGVPEKYNFSFILFTLFIYSKLT